MTETGSRACVRAWTCVLVALPFALLLVVASSGPVHPDSGDEGSATARFLKIDPGARTTAMGSASVAGSATPYTVQSNPALLGQSQSRAYSLTHQEIFRDVSYNNAAVVTPLDPSLGSLGFNLKSVDYGSQQRTRIDPGSSTGLEPIQELGSFSAGNLAFGTAWGKRWTEAFSTGLAVNYIRQSIAEFSGNTFAVDAGVHYRLVGDQLMFGASARNLVGDLKLNERSDPLPRVYEAGLYYERPLTRVLGVQAGFDVVTPSDADRYVAGGAELGFWDAFFLRAGYNGEQDIDSGLTFGGGIALGRFHFDYSMAEFGELGRQQKMTLNYSH